MPGSSRNLIVQTPGGTLELSPETADAELPADIKRSVYHALAQLGLRDAMMTNMAFLLEGDAQEVELGRNDVTSEDLPALARAYFWLPNWKTRAYMILLLTDYADEILQALWMDVLRAPVLVEHDERQHAKAIAVWRLLGSDGEEVEYIEDPARTHREAEALLTRTGD